MISVYFHWIQINQQKMKKTHTRRQSELERNESSKWIVPITLCHWIILLNRFNCQSGFSSHFSPVALPFHTLPFYRPEEKRQQLNYEKRKSHVEKSTVVRRHSPTLDSTFSPTSHRSPNRSSTLFFCRTHSSVADFCRRLFPSVLFAYKSFCVRGAIVPISKIPFLGDFISSHSIGILVRCFFFSLSLYFAIFRMFFFSILSPVVLHNFDRIDFPLCHSHRSEMLFFHILFVAVEKIRSVSCSFVDFLNEIRVMRSV